MCVHVCIYLCVCVCVCVYVCVCACVCVCVCVCVYYLHELVHDHDTHSPAPPPHLRVYQPLVAQGLIHKKLKA